MLKVNQSFNKRLQLLEKGKRKSQLIKDKLQNIDIKSFMAEVYYNLHDDITEKKHTFYNLPGGRGSGKSSFCALEVVYQIMSDESEEANCLVIRKYAVTLRASVFSQIRWAIEVLGVAEHWKYTLNPMQFTYETGQIIKLTGLDDPQKLKSIKPSKGYFRFLWLEEFSELSGEPELRNLQQSVLRGGDEFSVFRSFNPPISRINWANRFIEKEDDNSITLLTNYLQIPVDWLGQVFIDEAERLKKINYRAYENEYLGKAVGNGSDVFENLEVRKISEEEIKNMDRFCFGLDWGFSKDPCCFLAVSYDSKKEIIYILDEIYKTHLTNKQLSEEILKKEYFKPKYIGYTALFDELIQEEPIVICDSAEPKSIQDLRNEGIKAIPCHKFGGCVEYRIKWLQRRKIVVDPNRTPNTSRELQNYSYEIDKRSGEVLSSVPDKDNHSIDGLSYALDRVIYNKKYSA